VESKSIQYDIGSRQVTFTVTDKTKYDETAVKEALRKAGSRYAEYKVLSGPT
jgi:hypothetical protein